MIDRLFRGNCGLLDKYEWNMLNIYFCDKNYFVVPKPYLAKVNIEHADRLSRNGFIFTLFMFIKASDSLFSHRHTECRNFPMMLGYCCYICVDKLSLKFSLLYSVRYQDV